MLEETVSGSTKKRATYADVLAAPDGVVAEIIEGRLYTQPRPRLLHALVATELTSSLHDAFSRGRSGPGGWVVIVEPELHLNEGPDVLVPDLAAWTSDRFPTLDDDPAYLTVAPDWICEVLSPSTAGKDRVLKLPRYHAAGVAYAWLLDPATAVLDVLRRDDPHWRLTGSYSLRSPVRAEPFDAVELSLDALAEVEA